MKLIINRTYETATGHIISRSHFKDDAVPAYAIFEVLTRTADHFTVSHKLLTKKEIKKILHISAKEIIEII